MIKTYLKHYSMILYIITCEKLRHSSGMTGLKPVKSGFLLTFIITDVDTVIIFREKKFGRTTYSVDMEFFFFFTTITGHSVYKY